MQKRREEEDSGPPGFCHRLFIWVLSRLVGFWGIASSAHDPIPLLPADHQAAASSTEVPVEYTINGGTDHNKTVVPAEKDDKPISNGKYSTASTSVDDHDRVQDEDHIAGGGGGGIRGGKVMSKNTAGKGKAVRLPIEEGGGGGNIIKQERKGKGRQPIEEGGRKEERRPWPRLSLVTNINEKSADFIQKRKAVMHRTNTMKPTKS